eukprot:CAMPEP_0181323322 /NCGR_PEP_ID=MMETSP1101-20121128/19719_1 /TAXON_ID=46948 /ORGANISM="Rhodomonas abbreviata, Strain Caron Lab Isolate" /LENGTH=250 /DNA_ID=CAMNT_0023431333 /DNA_START=39 /DNA_END=791 /DNA_ORIENTATION=+
MSNAFEKKLIVITGSSSGIGEAVGRKLAAEGARVALLARRKDRLDNLAMELGGAPVALAISADVTKVETVKAAVAQAEAHFGTKVWGLVNCAGVMHYQTVSALDLESWDQQLDTNCRGVMYATAAVLPSLTAEEGRGGHIVNISSDAGRKAFPGLCVYSATKFFVEAWAQGLRTELAPKGIKVTNIQPGDVKTELLLHNRDPAALQEFGSGADAEMLEPVDIAEAIFFAMTRKKHCAVNEILVEPSSAPL